MAESKRFLLAVFLTIVLAGVGVGADESVADVGEGPKSDGADSALLEELKSRIQRLEHQVEVKTQQLRDKDKVIATKEKIIKETSDSIVSLESQVASLRRKLDAVGEVGKAQARAAEFEKQVEGLKRDIHVKVREKEKLESRLTEADREASVLNSKVNSLQKIIDGQKTELLKTEHSLRLAEEELTKAKLEVTSKDKELMEVHSAWFPPWLVVHFTYYQSLLEKNWQVHGKPAVQLCRQKTMEKKVYVEEWAAPHVETMKTKWIPAIREQWTVCASNIEPHVQTIAVKIIEIYRTSKEAVAPHVITVLEIVDPYFQQLKEVGKPYIGQVATAARPHIVAWHTTLKPYSQLAICNYGKFLELATTYHIHVQNRVGEKLRNHELTKPLATKELIWFTASALLALPVIFLLKIFSTVFCKKSPKPTGNSNSHHSRRKTRRGHATSKVQKS